MSDQRTPLLSVVVPLLDEEDNVLRLVESVRNALDGGDGGVTAWELILVDDGSTDRTLQLARDAASRDPRVRPVALARRYGQSTAMQVGFDHARAPVVVTMDGDLQNDPRDIPALVALLGEGYDMVTGYREDRQDLLLTRKLPSWVANRIIAWITGVRIRDNGCSLKAYRKDLLERVRLYSDMHRFIPAVAVGVAGARIAEIPVRHHPRRHGESKYGLSRAGKVLADLLAVKMIRSFRTRPLLMFGMGAVGSALIAGPFALAALLDALGPAGGSAVVFSGVSLLWLSLAAFLAMLGLVAEVAVREGLEGEPAPSPLVRELTP